MLSLFTATHKEKYPSKETLNVYTLGLSNEMVPVMLV